MARAAQLAPLALVLALLAATAASFAMSERLKLETVPIGDVHIRHKLFSPVCACDSNRVTIGFRLRRSDSLTVSILTGKGQVVTHLAVHERHRPGKLSFIWDGRDASGERVPDGTYRIRLELATHGRTINMPNRLRIDTVRPVVTISVPPHPKVFSPDGDHHADAIVVGYHVSEHAHARLYVNGRQVIETRYQPLHDGIPWYGKVGGRSLRPGTYRIGVGARDLAGNLARIVPAGVVRVRYLAVAPQVVRTRPRARLRLQVETDAHTYRWSLGTRHGFGADGHLVLRAPQAPGRHVLYVEERGHAARVVVVVRRG